jgi:hypothetical protein
MLKPERASWRKRSSQQVLQHLRAANVEMGTRESGSRAGADEKWDSPGTTIIIIGHLAAEKPVHAFARHIV